MPELRQVTSPRQVAAALAEQVRRLEGTARPAVGRVISTACPVLDRLLPEGGLRCGGLVEWLSGCPGSGVGTLSLAAAREAARDGGAVVIVDRQGEWYPPAIAGLGIDLERLIVVRPRRGDEAVWALAEALRCEAVAAAWSCLESIEELAFRRLQRAAETGGTLGLLWRPAAARATTSWADVRFWAEPLPSAGPRRWRVELLRCRGRAAAAPIEIEWDDEAGALRMAARLADSAPLGRAAGA